MTMKIRLFALLAFAPAALLLGAPISKVGVSTNQNPNIVASKAALVAKPILQFPKPPYDLKALADDIESRFKGKSIGYQFVVAFNSMPMISRAGGSARQAPDPSPRAMTVNDKYNIASVSKTITAAAALKLLHEQNIPLSTPMAKYLPASFKPVRSTASITLEQLLTHKSGLRCPNEVTYANLKACIATGVNAADKVFNYNNSNFALFRLIIPRLNGYAPPAYLTEGAESAAFAKKYMDYVQANVFTPAGLPKIECKPTDASPALCYHFPNDNGAGTDFGDMTETNGSRGWTLSSTQLTTFIRTLLYTEKILPKEVVAQMTSGQLGLYAFALPNGTTAYNHGGFYPGANNPGELNSLIVGTSDGVSVALIVNSQASSGGVGNSVLAALAAAAKKVQP
jgi:CubicO group peptidase (beta-lactamase class C family)